MTAAESLEEAGRRLLDSRASAPWQTRISACEARFGRWGRSFDVRTPGRGPMSAVIIAERIPL